MRSFMIHRSLLIILIFLLAFPGCRKKAPVPVPQPPPSASTVDINPAPPAITPPVPAPNIEPGKIEPLPKIVVTPDFFELAELNFQVGNYRQASQSFEKFLSSTPQSQDRPRALFHLGLSRALANDSSRDLRQAEAAFRRLISEYPKSPYSDQAEFILNLQGQIERLRADLKDRDDRLKRLGEELQKLKEIDMQRRPSRPKE